MVSRKPPPPPDFDDSAPILTAEEIKGLRPAREVFEELGIPLPVPRGRPKAATTKQKVTIRMDREVIAHYRQGGPGWQTRMNEILAREMHKARG